MEQFSIDIVNPSSIIEKYHLPEITSPIIMLKNGDFHEGGLFSPTIFGEMDSDAWNNQFSYIDLSVDVLHPFVYDICKRHFQAIISIIDNKKGLIITDDNKVKGISLKNTDITGFTVVKEYWNEIIDFLRQEKPEHSELLDRISDSNKVFINKWLVIPPKYRPVSIINGRTDYSPINDLYANLIRYAQRAAIMTGIGSDSSSRSLTKELYAIFTDIVAVLKGKGGLFRGSLLGKRVDFSARAVVSADPTIKTDEIGVPKVHAFKMSLPFVVHYIKNNIDILQRIYQLEGINSVSELLKIFQAFSEFKYKLQDETIDILYNTVLPEVVKDKVVVYKRDPVLHRESILAAKIKLVDDMTIHFPVTSVGPLNLDFDGDMVAIFMPMTIEGQEQAKKKLYVKNNIISGTDGSVQIKLSAEYILGLYYLTQFEPTSKVIYNFEGHNIPDHNTVKSVWMNKANYDASMTVKYMNSKITTLGRLLFVALINSTSGILLEPTVVTKKMYNKIINLVIKESGNEAYVNLNNELISITATQMTIYGKSFELKDFMLPPELEKEREELNRITDLTEYGKKSDELFAKFLKYLETEGAWTVDMIMSGAKSKANQFKQITIGKGVIMDPTGKTLDKPITQNLSEGMPPDKYFLAASGARKGMVDRSQNTAVTGYLTRKMVYAASSLLLSDTEDCGTDHYLEFSVINKDLSNSIKGRYIISDNGKLLLVGKDVDPDSLVGKIVKLRSPMYCKAKDGICKTCYGNLNSIHKSKNIGIIAAQSIGERNTQLAMQTFHTGGATTSTYNEKYLEEIGITEKRVFNVFTQTKDKIYSKANVIVQFLGYEDLLTEDTITTNKFFVVWDDGSKSYFESNSMLTFDVSGYTIDNESKLLVKMYNNNSFVAKVNASTADVVDAAKYVTQLLGRTEGKNLNAVQLLFKLFDIYSKIADIPLIHFELVITSMSRDPDNPTSPYRLSSYVKPEMLISIKNVPKMDNWLKAAMFEGFKQSLEVGLKSKYVNVDDPLIKINFI